MCLDSSSPTGCRAPQILPSPSNDRQPILHRWARSIRARNHADEKSPAPARATNLASRLFPRSESDERLLRHSDCSLESPDAFSCHVPRCRSLHWWGLADVHVDRTAAGRVKPHSASLQGKCAMNRVQRAAQRPVQFALRRVEMQDYLAGLGFERRLRRLCPSARRNHGEHDEYPGETGAVFPSLIFCCDSNHVVRNLQPKNCPAVASCRGRVSPT